MIKTKKDIDHWLSKNVSDWELKFPPYQYQRLDSGIQVYSLNSSSKDLCYCELIFANGRILEHKKMSARFTSIMMQEGTLEYNSAAVADFFDYYGASYSIHADLDFTSISFSCLQKFFEPLLQFIIHLITEPAFREEDLNRCKLFIQSQLKHQLAEPDFVSYREFTAHIFGNEKTYGYNTTQENISEIKIDDLKEYHQRTYVANELKVFYCGEDLKGNFWEQSLKKIRTKKEREKLIYHTVSEEVKRLHFPIEHSTQISMKLGCRMFSKMDSDFYPLYFINTVLGDYFGSRLMKNIREDKGFTYDIHSTLDAQLFDGCFYISAELNPSELDVTLSEIQKEFLKIQTQSIGDEELIMVKRYLHGHLQRLLDGSFQSILFLKILVTEYNNSEAYRMIMNTIRDIDAKQIQSLATKYLQFDRMSLVTSG